MLAALLPASEDGWQGAEHFRRPSAAVAGAEKGAWLVKDSAGVAAEAPA